MDDLNIISEIKNKYPYFSAFNFSESYEDEVYIDITPQDFHKVCLALHKALRSPVMMLFAQEEPADQKKFRINCVFLSVKYRKWVFVRIDLGGENPAFDSLAKSIYSAGLFEREIKEMFGIEPVGNPDLRRLNLHEEVWPEGNFPLRKGFKETAGIKGEYRFSRVEGEGIFEVPVGPVHAGIIGPGHFRFSAAGEPIINLEIRLGFTHRGVEKLFEGKSCREAAAFAECVSGDACFAHSSAFCHAVEKIIGITPSKQTAYLRAIFLELERLYNHVNDVAGIAVDVGFSFPAALASVLKETILQLNEALTQSRYLKKINAAGGILTRIDEGKKKLLIDSLQKVAGDFKQLTGILNSSVSFMDRVDGAGILRKRTAEDLGVLGLAARASGIPFDLRKYFFDCYQETKFNMQVEQGGDVLARLKLRISEFEESLRLIGELAAKLAPEQESYSKPVVKPGEALGYSESWRGPVLYWVKINSSGTIERCKIVDVSFHNWQGLSFAVLGNIIPDFPVCNKSFDLSYPGNDL